MKLTNKQLDTLKKLGLTDTQLRLYLISLEHGLLTVMELAKLTKFSRQKIYEEAEKLIDLGLYDVTRKQGRKYIPAHPSRLLTLGQTKIANIQSSISEIAKLIPVLESSNQPKKNAVKVKYYEGLERIKKAYQEELEICQKTEVLTMVGSMDDIYKFFPEKYWDKWNEQFVLQKSHSRMLVHDSEVAKSAARLDIKYNRQTKFLNKFPLRVNMDIFKNTVLIVSCYDELAIWIESKMIADSYQIMFNTLWAIAE